MPAYTTLAKVMAELPADRPNNPATELEFTAEAWQTRLTEIIAENSQLVDDGVGGNYSFAYKTSTQKFPDITDDPATPSTIEKICRYLCIVDALAYHSGYYTEGDNSARLRRRNWAEFLRSAAVMCRIGFCMIQTGTGVCSPSWQARAEPSMT